MEDYSREYMQGWDGTDVFRDPNRSAAFPRRATTENELTTYVGGNPNLPHPASLAARRLPRLLRQDGSYTLIPKNIPNWLARFASDFFNTLLDMTWIWIVIFFLLSNLTVWLIFTGIFYSISFWHGDFDARNFARKDWEPCIYSNGSMTFASTFLFSVETLRTIGYGPRYPTEQCGATVFFLCFSCIVSMLLESVLVGLLLAKTHVPQSRTQTLMFSRNATMCTRDNQMCLLFRIGNVRTSLLFHIVLKAYLVYAKRTEEGEEMPFHQHEIDVQIDANGDNVYLGWPITASHVVDSSSPFYHLSKKNLDRAAFELIVILEGIVESTGASIQARTSYVPREILWGKRFRPMYTPDQDDPSQLFDYAYFNETSSQPDMRDMSAFELEELADLRAVVPEVILSSCSFSEDVYDAPIPSGANTEVALSPSLAQALDIPFDEIQYRNRAHSFRQENLRLHNTLFQSSATQPRSRRQSVMIPSTGLNTVGMSQGNRDGMGSQWNRDAVGSQWNRDGMGSQWNRDAAGYGVEVDGLRLGHPCRNRRQSTAVFSISPPTPSNVHRAVTSRSAIRGVSVSDGVPVRRRRKSSEL